MSEVIDTVTADSVEDTDTIEYVNKHGQTRLLVVKSIEDTGSHILITGLPDDRPGGEKITIRFQPDDYVDIIGS